METAVQRRGEGALWAVVLNTPGGVGAGGMRDF